MIGEGRLRDWLSLLGFEVASTRRYLFTPPWSRRLGATARSWLERRGPGSRRRSPARTC